MKRIISCFQVGCWLMLGSLVFPGFAQVPNLITYHGRLQSGSEDYHGLGRFKFAIVDAGTDVSEQATARATLSEGRIDSVIILLPGNGYVVNPAVTIEDATGTGAIITATVAGGVVMSLTVVDPGVNYRSPIITIEPPPADLRYVTYWSHDGTSLAGSEPDGFVELPVDQGLFHAVLGQNMRPLDSALFANPGLHLRVWVDTDNERQSQPLTSSFVPLIPDQLLTTTPYTMVAAQVEAGGVTGDMIAPGAVDVVHLSQAAQNAPWNNLHHLELGDAENYGSLRIFHNEQDEPSIILDGETARLSVLGDEAAEKVILTGENYGHLSLFNNDDTPPTVILTGINEAAPVTDEGGGALYLGDVDGARRSVLAVTTKGGALSLFGAEPMPTKSLAQLRADQDGGRLIVNNANDSSRSALSGGRLTLGDEGGSDTVVLTQDTSGGHLLAYDEDGMPTASLGSAGAGGQALIYQSDGQTPGIEMIGRATTLQGGRLRVYRPNGNYAVSLNAGSGQSGGSILLHKPDGSQAIVLDADDVDGKGRVTTEVLEITGGSDLSERFDISHVRETIQPGMVVCIDPNHPGRLLPSSQAYDRTVAGVVSGAGGVRPGMLMGQTGTAADGQHPVALTGRVYCLVDADYGVVKPGDLITTSDTPGHGMVIGDYQKGQGAILGKAMTGLEEGRGLVLVLVSLQ